MDVPENLNVQNQVHELIKEFLREDIGSGDLTTNTIIPKTQHLRGTLTAKEDGIIAGLAAAEQTFALLGDKAAFSPRVADGEAVASGQIIADIEGSARTILSAERTALNILQRMSGIATETRKFVDAVGGSSAVILDTRKTAPGLRLLDKLAVRTGGAQNHRFGLFDMVLIKDNHITAAGSITEAVRRARSGITDGIKIEVEVKNHDELKEALNLGVDRILLDNMTLHQMEEAVSLAGGRVPLEASGNMTLEKAAATASAGIDYISVGSLTHSVKALDISLLLESPEALV